MFPLLMINFLVVSFFINIEISHSYSVRLNPEAERMLRALPENYVLRVPTSEAVAEHITLATKASDVVRQTVPHELNIRYGNREKQLLDIYGTDLPQGSPIYLYIHGGSWSQKEYTKENSAYPVIPLWQEGVKVVVGEYDLSPNITLNVMIEEIKELAMFVLKMAEKENCRNVWIGGHSAGAHLAATLLRAEWYNALTSELKGRIQGFVLISGGYNLTPLISLPLNKVLQLDNETVADVSPTLSMGTITATRPVTVLLVTAQQDSPFLHDQTLEYYKVIRKQASVNVTFLEVPDLTTDHFSVAINLQDPKNMLTKKIFSLIKC